MTKPIRDRHKRSGGQGQGMNGICRPDKRVALYLRDGLACTYCSSGIEDGIKLTLDHVIPHSLGGSNDESNLVTACFTCNSARGNRDYKDFAEKVAGYRNHDRTGAEIVAHIDATRQRPLDRKQAQELLARRGGFTATMQSLRS